MFLLPHDGSLALRTNDSSHEGPLWTLCTGLPLPPGLPPTSAVARPVLSVYFQRASLQQGLELLANIEPHSRQRGRYSACTLTLSTAPGFGCWLPYRIVMLPEEDRRMREGSESRHSGRAHFAPGSVCCPSAPPVPVPSSAVHIYMHVYVCVPTSTPRIQGHSCM